MCIITTIVKQIVGNLVNLNCCVERCEELHKGVKIVIKCKLRNKCDRRIIVRLYTLINNKGEGLK